jgi:hypothetical protein
MCCKYASCAIHICLLCRLKMSQVAEILNMLLFLDLLACCEQLYCHHCADTIFTRNFKCMYIYFLNF